MGSKKLQNYVHMIGLILLIITVSLKMLGYQVSKVISYSVVVIAGVYIFLLSKNRYRPY